MVVDKPFHWTWYRPGQSLNQE